MERGVGEGAREGGYHRGFVGVVAVQVGDPDLQSDVLLVAQLDHGHVVLPRTGTMECNNNNNNNRHEWVLTTTAKNKGFAFTVPVE